MFSDPNLYSNFVKASERLSGENFRNNNTKVCQDIQGRLSGREAKEFYDDLVSSTVHINDTDSSRRTNLKDPFNLGDKRVERVSKRRQLEEATTTTTKSAVCSHNKSRKKCLRRKSSENDAVSSRFVNKYLQHAQNGDLNEVKILLSDDKVDIDVCDQFGWTALMCSAYNGHKDIVKYLLSQGASWKNTKNARGQTVLDLSKLAKQQDIVELLTNWDLVNCRSSRRKYSDKATRSPFWCCICQQDFTEDKKKHQSSTVHLFNCQHKPKDTYFSIPINNPGYKMMVKSGWDDEKGLGPEGEGRKYPIKTVLKRDRYGLGSSKSSKPRVTHFGPNDEEAVKIKKNHERKESKRTLSKKQKRMKESKEKAWERNMRLYMNT
ncbi:G patch domain and ankyrin repeat-containing protein 1 [Exaiptasia diaphana]|uniref:G-patch domain-containing protein n=1 Tax=Exaiptasia diaphana TaxID=2652724 RepID=A0A913Y3L8_EXADI|nr:G patch domain and ankyrin repeat-containing protein 1 [Exaiptasia diaphana]KXJ22839.1 G patch domain and ankyrin repeat-containing protein 1 [Exaiptasia diaphana]